MKSAYRYLALAIPALVLVQAASIAYAVFAQHAWVSDGHTLTGDNLDSGSMGGAQVGFAIHRINGQMVIPLVAIALLVVAFLAKDVPESVKWAAMMFGSVVIQVLVGVLGADLPLLGLIHGVLAVGILGLGLRVAQQTHGSGRVATS